MPRCLVEVKLASKKLSTLSQIPAIPDWFITDTVNDEKLGMPSRTLGRIMDLRFEYDGIDVATSTIDELEQELGRRGKAEGLYPSYSISMINLLWYKP